MPNAVLTYWKLHKVPILLSILCGLLYYTFAYHLQRSDFARMFGLYLGLFILCYKLIQFEKWNYKFLLFLGVVFRLVFLFAIPNLSQDFYRFIWDGHLVLLGENPYLYLPVDLVGSSEIIIPQAGYLVEGMESLSASNFSNYPPLSQLLFGLSVWLGGGKILGSVIAIRLILLLADLGIFYFGRKLLKFVNKSPHLIFWYFLNPLIIIELGGNLHFEGVMLFFLLITLYLIAINKWMLAALPMALSISVKLIPLMFLPLFFKALGLKKGLIFNTLVFLILAATLLPFYNPAFAENYMATLSLWFSNFEFNASIYNVVKSLGESLDLKPWELIKSYGKLIPLIVIVWVGILSLLRKNSSQHILIQSMLFILALYFFLTPTVHPWYIITLVALCIFTDYRFPLVWSATIIFSYTAYRDPGTEESMGFLIIEYLSVYGFLIYEIFKHGSFKSLIPKKYRGKGVNPI
ncbi:mannosyltransferase [Muriicola sp. SD30]|uniref:mannosyltransferase n=1 Tax=Muriicola sp. SD30 TaxID=3240936 RepID=UPI00350E955E